MTDDPLKDWAQKCAQEEEWRNEQDACDECGGLLIENGDYYFSIQNMIYCEECMMNKFRRWLD